VDWIAALRRVTYCIAEHTDTPGVTPGWINGVGLRAAYDF
jgi:hypothetical protein